MNDNVPESERWVPVKGTVNETFTPSHTLDRARREAEAVIAKAFAEEEEAR